MPDQPGQCRGSALDSRRPKRCKDEALQANVPGIAGKRVRKHRGHRYHCREAASRGLRGMDFGQSVRSRKNRIRGLPKTIGSTLARLAGFAEAQQQSGSSAAAPDPLRQIGGITIRSVTNSPKLLHESVAVLSIRSGCAIGRVTAINSSTRAGLQCQGLPGLTQGVGNGRVR